MHNQKKDSNEFKNKNNQNCQKIKLYGSLTTKELKKKHSFRLVGVVETSSRGGEDYGWRTGWRRQWLADQVDPHLPVDKLGGTTGERDRLHNPGFWREKRKPQNL